MNRPFLLLALVLAGCVADEPRKTHAGCKPSKRRIMNTQTQLRIVLRNAGVSSGVPVTTTGAPITYTSSWQDTSSWPANSAADPSTGESVAVMGSSSETIITERPGSRTYRIAGGDAIIVKEVCARELSPARATRVCRVVVRPDADRERVAEWLFEHLDPRAAARAAAREAALRKSEMLRFHGLGSGEYERLLVCAEAHTRFACEPYYLEVVRYSHSVHGLAVDFEIVGGHVGGHIGCTDPLWKRAVAAALAV